MELPLLVENLFGLFIRSIKFKFQYFDVSRRSLLRKPTREHGRIPDVDHYALAHTWASAILAMVDNQPKLGENQ
jgi:hypothetical protein